MLKMVWRGRTIWRASSIRGGWPSGGSARSWQKSRKISQQKTGPAPGAPPPTPTPLFLLAPLSCPCAVWVASPSVNSDVAQVALAAGDAKLPC